MELRYLIIILQVSAACVLGLTTSQCKPESSYKGLHFLFGIMAPFGRPHIHILLTTDLTANIRLIIPYINMDKHYTFTNHTDIPLPGNITHMVNGTDRKGFEIISDVPVSVTVIIGFGDFLEGYLALPTDALSKKYIVASYTPYSSHKSEFLLVGVEDLSNISIELPLNYQNHGHYSIPINVQLNKYVSYQFQGPYDVSGTIIRSDAPVVVMAGSQASKIPVGKGDYQYLVEQMIPTSHWNYRYIVPSIYPRWGYTIKIFATVDNTHVTFSNSTQNYSAVLNEHTHETLQLGQEPVIVTADKPIYVVQYGMDIDGSYGDPFMMNVQAISQFQSKYALRTQPVYGLNDNTLAITIKAADVAGLQFDGSHSAIQSAVKVSVSSPLSEYTVIFFNITYNSLHVLQHSSNRPFGAVIYGLPGTTIAYGYPLSLMFKNKECQTPQPISLNSTTTPSQGQGHHQSGNGTQCFSCDEMAELKYCDTVQSCKQGEVCYVESYVTNKIVKHYRSGCISQSKCTSGHQQLGSECLQCCDGDFCNTHGCGDGGILNIDRRGPICYDCERINDLRQCQQVKICSANQLCRIEKYSWANNDVYYNTGCTETQCTSSRRSARDVGRRNVPICLNCCTTDFCNNNCTGGFDFSVIG